MSRPILSIAKVASLMGLTAMLSCGCGSDSGCKGDNCNATAVGGLASAGGTTGSAGGASSISVGGTSDSNTSDFTGGTTSNGGYSTTSGGATAITSGGNSGTLEMGGAPSGGVNTSGTGGASVTSIGGAGTSMGGTSATPTGGTASALGGTGTANSSGGSTTTGGTSPLTSGGVESSGGTSSGGGTEAGGQSGNDTILKYDFEDGVGSTVTDTSLNGNDGTLVNVAFTQATEGRNGMGGEFDQADSTVKLPDDLFKGVNELTVTAWVYLTDNQAWNHLFDFGTGTENDLYFTFNNSSGGMELGVRLNGSAPSTLFTTTMLPLNVWKHVAITLSGSGAFMYVDGREVARAPGLAVVPSALGNTTSNWIGKSQFPDPEFSGRIDEFYVYRRALTKAEIAALAWPKTDYSIWHFEEASGTVAHDASDNARDGTLVNATWTSGPFGGAVQLYNPGGVTTPSASDQYVQLPSGILKNCTQGYTVAAWINVAAVFNHQRIFNFGNDAGHFIAARTKGGMTQQLALVNNTDGTERYANINFNWSTSTWYHVAVVRNGQTLYAYLNGSTTGVASATNVVTAAMPTADTLGDTPYDYIGKAQPTATDSRMHGFVDEFLVSCRAFTADEIMQLAYLPPS